MEALQNIPKELYFPKDDSIIVRLYGQFGVPTTRDLILISSDPMEIRKELFHVPTVSVCYRAIYTVRVGEARRARVRRRTCASECTCCWRWRARWW